MEANNTRSLIRGLKRTHKEREQENDRKAKRALVYIYNKLLLHPIIAIRVRNKPKFLVDLIHTNTKIPINHILLCLTRVRYNATFFELAHKIGISASKAVKLFKKCMPVIYKFLKPFIFRANDSNISKVSCIDSFEIEIDKPPFLYRPSTTWSDKRKADTLKYLISMTSYGCVNYISPGLGGRLTDAQLLESCDFLELLEPGSRVLATEGFRNIEHILMQNQCTSLKSPDVGPDGRTTSEDILKKNQIARLRTKLQIVVKRVQRYSMLKPHSVVNKNFMCVIDECVTMACAIINLRNIII